jgi:hypothetical protein
MKKYEVYINCEETKRKQVAHYQWHLHAMFITKKRLNYFFTFPEKLVHFSHA